MEIKNRLFSYPVLCVENDDYIDCSFNVKTRVTEELTDLLLSFEVMLENNDELSWLIRDGAAEVIVHIECSSTAYRKVVSITGNKHAFRLPKSRVNNDVYLVGMIIAKKDIKNFTSVRLNEDYGSESINFQKGYILAYRNLPKIFITKNYEELAGDNSFFTIIKRTTQDGEEAFPVVYEMNSPKIKILVDEKTYDEYIKYHNNPLMEPITNTLLVMPAIANMVEVLRETGSDSFKPLFWYQKIKEACRAQGKDFERDILDSEKSCMEIAQELLHYPIARAFESISRVIEG